MAICPALCLSGPPSFGVNDTSSSLCLLTPPHPPPLPTPLIFLPPAPDRKAPDHQYQTGPCPAPIGYYVCVCACVCVSERDALSTRMHACVDTGCEMSVFICACVCLCVLYVYVYINTYIHKYIFTYTYIRVSKPRSVYSARTEWLD